MEPCYCVLDTNIFLHFRRFTLIDWKAELSRDVVVLVVPTAVLRELDRAKTERDSRISHRARTALKELERCLSAGRISEGVVVRPSHSEPAPDWQAHGLDASIDDDRIIAETLLLQRDHEDVLIVTDDSAVKVKAWPRLISVHELSEGLRMDDRLTAAQVENERLRQQLRELTSAMPVLALQFEPDRGSARVLTFVYTEPSVQTEAEMDNEIREERTRRGLVLSPAPDETTIGGEPRRPAWSDLLDSYRRPGEAYLSRYREYLEERRAHSEAMALTLQLPLVLVNTGSGPAEAVAVWLHLPDGLEVLSADDVPDSPQPPDPESMSPFGLAGADRIAIGRIRVPSLSRLAPSPTAPHITRSNSYEVTFELGRVRQQSSTKLDPLYVVFASSNHVQPFHIDYRITANNLPGVAEGQLHVRTE